MSDLDLTLIKARLARARHLPVFLTEGDIAKARENRKGLYRWHLEGTWDDAVLFGRARDDIAALVAEVGRLSGLLGVVKKIHEKRVDPDDPDGEFCCDACRDEWGMLPFWPCPTMRALGVTEQ